MKHCAIAWDRPGGVRLCTLELPDDATVGMALIAAAEPLGTTAAELERHAVGIFGRVCSRDDVPLEGDRIEIYQPLRLDPRARRRARAAASRRAVERR